MIKATQFDLRHSSRAFEAPLSASSELSADLMDLFGFRLLKNYLATRNDSSLLFDEALPRPQWAGAFSRFVGFIFSRSHVVSRVEGRCAA